MENEQLINFINNKIKQKQSLMKSLLQGKQSFIQIPDQFEQGRAVEVENSIEDLRDILLFIK